MWETISPMTGHIFASWGVILAQLHFGHLFEASHLSLSRLTALTSFQSYKLCLADLPDSNVPPFANGSFSHIHP